MIFVKSVFKLSFLLLVLSLTACGEDLTEKTTDENEVIIEEETIEEEEYNLFLKALQLIFQLSVQATLAYKRLHY